VRSASRLLGPLAALVCATSCEAILDIPERETAPHLVCTGPDECQCQAPFADCHQADVCDVDTRSDPANCGGCGIDCQGQACVEGACGCDTSPCKLSAPQCGCEEGLACTIEKPSAQNPSGRVCEPGGALGLDAPCSLELGRCLPGMVCVRDGEDSFSCRAFCDTDASCAAGALGQPMCSVRLFFGEGERAVEAPGAVVCSDDCDPVSNAGCPADGQCKLVVDSEVGMRWYTNCSTPGDDPLGTQCVTGTACAPGLACSGATDQCEEICSEIHPCPAGQVCNPGPFVGTIQFGVCIPD
jgi:hypothetical protein